MADRTVTPEELTAILERFPVERAGGRNPSEISEAQVRQLLARITALTDALREAGDSATARIASQLLLSDLALVAAQYRARANAMRASLAKALDDLRDVKGSTPPSPPLGHEAGRE